MKIGIIGAGSFGLVIAAMMFEKDYSIKVWEHNNKKAHLLNSTRKDPKRLPGFVLPQGVEVISDISKLKDSDIVIFAIPTDTFPEVVKRLASIFIPKNIVSVSKGIIEENLKTPGFYLAEHFNKSNIGVLSGPTIARELAAKKPTSAVAASASDKFAVKIQEIFHTSYMRPYTSNDMLSVELGGALKNVIAIAAGMVDGARLGINAKGALLTRGIVEIQRLATELGANPITLSGLSGFGDLITTSFSPYSRNRTVGELLAKGEQLNIILKNLNMVAEGVKTSEIATKLAKIHNVDLPITFAVNSIIKGQITVMQAIKNLMDRTLKGEY